MENWRWIWPRVGAVPITQGTDSEMFDRTDYPYSDTFVREAIQNTLDARLDLSNPAKIKFRFQSGDKQSLHPFVSGAVDLRKQANLFVPDEWDQCKIDWITIEDFNTRGLSGDLTDRLGDFWNYWLNFGLSNKSGRGRGGRGIGRVTFLIASRLQTVIGLTRRKEDGLTAAAGMTILNAMRTPEGFCATHAYLAAEEDNENSIFLLHKSDDFHTDMAKAFGFDGYQIPPYHSGLALAIPYPHPELTPQGILASAIEHFAPAIIGNTLTVEVNDTILDGKNIYSVATEVEGNFKSDWIRQDAQRFLKLVTLGIRDNGEILSLEDVSKGFSDYKDSEFVSNLQSILDEEKAVSFSISFPLVRNSKTHKVSLRIVASQTPENKLPVDRLFREGMSLPDVKTKNPGDIDLLIFVEDLELATYLNLCEGKAHLDLLESKEIRGKLEAKGYWPIISVKRFVKSLPSEIRMLLIPDITEPELDVFDAFFAIPDIDSKGKKHRGGKPEDQPPPPDPPPPPRISPFRVSTLEDGFRIEANPEFELWPVNMSFAIAYADGSRNPSWSPLDFKFDQLENSASGCVPVFSKNKLTARDCTEECRIEVTGFDTRRELDTKIRIWRNASNN